MVHGLWHASVAAHKGGEKLLKYQTAFNYRAPLGGTVAQRKAYAVKAGASLGLEVIEVHEIDPYSEKHHGAIGPVGSAL